MNTINKFRIFFFSVMTMMGVSAWGQGTGLSVVPNELSFGANEKTEEREAAVVTTNEDYENQCKSFTIAQLPKDIAFTVSTSSISFENVGGENNFTVTSNVDLELVAVDDGTNGVPSWFRLDKTQFQSPDADSNTEPFKVTVDKNRLLKGRSGRISIRHDGTEMGIVSVEQDGSFASVTVSAVSFNFEAESKGKSKTLVVTSNVPITTGSVSGGWSDWLAVSPSEITHNDATVSTEKNFTLSVKSDNTIGKVREAKFNVTWKDENDKLQTKEIIVVQMSEDIIFTVSTSSISFENVGGENNFTVTSNVDLELVAVDDGTNGAPSWFRLDKTQFQSPDANGNTESFKVTVDKNRLLKGRSGRISIRHDGTEMGIVSVEQDGSFASVTVSAVSFNFEAESKGKSKTLVVTSNVPITTGSVSGGWSDWLSVSPSEITHDDATVSSKKSFTLTVKSDNTSDKKREAKFSVTWTDENGKLQTKEIIVVQHSHYLCVSTSTLHYEPSGGSMTVNVASDIDWNVEVVGGGDWLSVTPFRGKNDGVLTVTATESSILSPRTATIILLGSGLTLYVEVYQEGNGYLTVDRTELSHNAAGGTMSFNICSNIEWSIDVEYVEGGTDWLTIFPQSGSGNEKITITVSPNADNEPRCAILTVSGRGLSQVVVCANYDVGISNVTNEENINNIYNVLGQKVEKSSIDRLPIGIYVINGVKVLKSNK